MTEPNRPVTNQAADQTELRWPNRVVANEGGSGEAVSSQVVPDQAESPWPNRAESGEGVPGQAVSGRVAAGQAESRWSPSNEGAELPWPNRAAPGEDVPNQAAPRRAASNRAAAIVAAVIFGTAAVAAGIVLVFSSGHDPVKQPTGSPDGLVKPTSFAATVYMEVHVGAYGRCEGGGYSDISAGSQVEIVNQKNEVLAHGTLARSSETTKCAFSASVTDIPAGEKMYGAKMGNANRGVIWKNETEARNGWALSLGD
ncbi:hypothetical protein [Actinocrispum wychmicini]|uniref:Uncharacterized protein n=1 Tax=Actinocrispum wychmicini TaxID=1213861 RepID=A0A4R2J745_9PSEU|nr:hypothetical protein [Actinocrispum wychmicini]TCO52396.1 hypothetical protein EV192_112128 [Actinocrispum wychmicini]